MKHKRKLNGNENKILQSDIFSVVSLWSIFPIHPGSLWNKIEERLHEVESGAFMQVAFCPLVSTA